MRSTNSLVSLAVALFVAAIASGCAGASNDETASGEQDLTKPARGPSTPGAKQVLWVLDKSKTKAIVCSGGAGKNVRIEPGKNTDDNTGLVVKGDYSYGTDEIKELWARDNLVIEWGEEGNYLLTIPNWSWSLFGYDGETTSPAFDASAEAVATIVSEQESVDTLKCKVEK